jgi:hypothetical protein
MVLKLGHFRKYSRNTFEVSCWRRMENIGWTERVRNKVLLRVKEKRNILHTVKRRKVNSIGHILRGKCLLKHVIEGKIGGIEVREDKEDDVSSY